MKKEKFLESFINAVNKISQHKQGCYYWWLDTDNNGNNWAIVLGWQDGYEEDNTDELSDKTWHLAAKVAYQPRNSIMQCDYDVDWIMPNYKDGDVWDTNITVYLNDNHKETVDWLIDQFLEMKKILPCWNEALAIC